MLFTYRLYHGWFLSRNVFVYFSSCSYTKVIKILNEVLFQPQLVCILTFVLIFRRSQPECSF